MLNTPKFGIYSSAGTYTCGGRFGSLGYEEIDANTYAEWGVDYLSKLVSYCLSLVRVLIYRSEYDNCYNEGRAGTPLISYERYANMSRALNATGRPILYSMCNWGEDGPWNFAPVRISFTPNISALYPCYCRTLQTVGVYPVTLWT